jgi:hypothetical protein
MRPLLLKRRIEEIWIKSVSSRGDRGDRGDSGTPGHCNSQKDGIQDTNLTASVLNRFIKGQERKEGR